MSRIAIIPARGGSKRLPRKNILPVSGRPMVAWPVQIAQDSGVFDRVLVSTEDDEIAEVAQSAGAEVIRRPSELAGDTVPIVRVCQHILGMLHVDEFCVIYATAALLRSETIVDALHELYREPRANYVMGVSEFNHPPVQALKENDEGFLSYMWPEFLGKQSQSYPRLCVSNGTFVWADASAFSRDGSFYAPRLRGYRVPDEEVCDVDTLEDYQRLLQRLEGRS